MIKSLKIALVFTALLISYIIIINFVASIPLAKEESQNNQKVEPSISSGGFIERIAINTQVSVTIERNRWYGKIYEINGNSNLYLFRLVPLPLVKDGIKFWRFHYFFMIIIGIAFIGFILVSKEK